MQTRRFVPAAGQLTAITALLASTACGAAGRGPVNIAERPIEAATTPRVSQDVMQQRGPRVNIVTRQTLRPFTHLEAVVTADDDAYVAIVNIQPDGAALVLFPSDSADDGFLRGGKAYRIPRFFPGFTPTAVPPIGASGQFRWFERSTLARLSARGPGYLLLVASWTPLDLDALEAAGLYDQRSIGNVLSDLDPLAVGPRIVQIAAGDPTTVVSFDHARYGGYEMYRPVATHASRLLNQCGYGLSAFDRSATWWPMSIAYAPFYNPCAFAGYVADNGDGRPPRWPIERDSTSDSTTDSPITGPHRGPPRLEKPTRVDPRVANASERERGSWAKDGATPDDAGDAPAVGPRPRGRAERPRDESSDPVPMERRRNRQQEQPDRRSMPDVDHGRGSTTREAPAARSEPVRASPPPRQEPPRREAPRTSPSPQRTGGSSSNPGNPRPSESRPAQAPAEPAR